MQQPRNVLRVVVHAKSLLDPFTDQRTRPDSRLESGCQWTGFDDANDLRPLLLR